VVVQLTAQQEHEQHDANIRNDGEGDGGVVGGVATSLGDGCGPDGTQET